MNFCGSNIVQIDFSPAITSHSITRTTFSAGNVPPHAVLHVPHRPQQNYTRVHPRNHETSGGFGYVYIDIYSATISQLRISFQLRIGFQLINSRQLFTHELHI